jgi:uncharacterized protein (TIGR02246 family)
MPCRRQEGQRAKPALWCCLALALIASSCGQQTPPDTRAADESAIRALDAQWEKAAAARDVDGTVSYYSDDASLLAPNAPIAGNKQAIRAAWASLLGPDVSLSWQANKVEVSRSSDLAYIVGVYQLAMKDPQGKPATDRGKFVEVWKKQADGKWKVVADIFNSDLALPAPPAPAEKKTSRHRHSKKRSHRNSGSNAN